MRFHHLSAWDKLKRFLPWTGGEPESEPEESDLSVAVAYRSRKVPPVVVLPPQPRRSAAAPVSRIRARKLSGMALYPDKIALRLYTDID